MKLSRVVVQMGQADLQCGRAAGRNIESQAFDQASSGFALTARFQPEKGESERGIDRGLGFLLVPPKRQQGASTLAKEPACIDRRKTSFQVHGGGEASAIQLPIRDLPAQ